MISVTGEVIDGEIDRTGVLAGVGRSLGDLDFACKCIARLGELALFQSVGEGDLVGAAHQLAALACGHGDVCAPVEDELLCGDGVGAFVGGGIDRDGCGDLDLVSAFHVVFDGCGAVGGLVGYGDLLCGIPVDGQLCGVCGCNAGVVGGAFAASVAKLATHDVTVEVH